MVIKCSLNGCYKFSKIHARMNLPIERFNNGVFNSISLVRKIKNIFYRRSFGISFRTTRIAAGHSCVVF